MATAKVEQFQPRVENEKLILAPKEQFSQIGNAKAELVVVRERNFLAGTTGRLTVFRKGSAFSFPIACRRLKTGD